MTPTTPEADHVAKCRAKVRYVTADEAKAAGARRVRGGKVAALWVYHCNVCFGWHLTKRHRGYSWSVDKPNPFATIMK